MTLDIWTEHLTQEPRLRDYLVRIVQHVLKQQTLPPEISLGPVPEDPLLLKTLTTLLGPTNCRIRNNRFKLRLCADQREPAAWQALTAIVQLPATQPNSHLAQTHAQRTFQRLSVLFPEHEALIHQMKQVDVFQRLARTHDNASQLLSPLLQSLAIIDATPAGITLSELGAKLFNDSKALRSGPKRVLLLQLLRLHEIDHDASDTLSDRDVLTLANIIDNPYTTHVAIFAPFAYETQTGEWLDWPTQLFMRGQAALLAWETVRTLRRLRWTAPCAQLVSSENAAPFHRLVEDKIPALYTEGYPNTAVTTLVRQIAKTGSTLTHWGDTDLDGYRIQARLASFIATETYPRKPEPRNRIPLDHARYVRLERFLIAHPDFPYYDALRHTLQFGWCEQESEL